MGASGRRTIKLVQHSSFHKKLGTAFFFSQTNDCNFAVFVHLFLPSFVVVTSAFDVLQKPIHQPTLRTPGASIFQLQQSLKDINKQGTQQIKNGQQAPPAKVEGINLPRAPLIRTLPPLSPCSCHSQPSPSLPQPTDTRGPRSSKSFITAWRTRTPPKWLGTKHMTCIRNKSKISEERGREGGREGGRDECFYRITFTFCFFYFVSFIFTTNPPSLPPPLPRSFLDFFNFNLFLS